jgi:hypothetical protein
VNIEKVTGSILLLNLVACSLIFGTIAYLSYTPTDSLAQTIFIVTSAGAVSITMMYLILKTSYIVGLFRVNGYKDGDYYVRLRIYAAGGKATLRAHDKKIFRADLIKGDSAHLPRSPSWVTLASKDNNQILLCGLPHIVTDTVENFYKSN